MRRLLAGLAGIMLGLALTGCGVQPTGVLDFGDPPGRITEPTAYVYLLHEGRLRPMARNRTLVQGLDPVVAPQELGGPAGNETIAVRTALTGLLIGPTEAEARDKVTSGLDKRARLGLARLVEEKSDEVLVVAPVAGFSERDQHQVTCSVARTLRITEPAWAGTVRWLDPGSDDGTPVTGSPCPPDLLTALPYAPSQAAVG